MNMQQAMSFLRHTFPDVNEQSGESAVLCAHPAAQPIVDVFDFASFAATALEKRDDRRVHEIFDVVENFLVEGPVELRDWVADAIEALQGICAWRRETCTFAGLLGRETRVLWDRLEFLRRASSDLDLSDCSVFEAEILTWRFVREKSRALTAAA
jgi:hypothetical protein